MLMFVMSCAIVLVYQNFRDECDEEVDKNTDPRTIEDYTDHDCKTIRKFNESEPQLVPHIMGTIRLNCKGTFWIKKTMRDTIVKYNSAYGIPIFGQEHFTDEAMIRACYLIR